MLPRQGKRQNVPSRSDSDVLPAADGVGHRRGTDRMVGLEVPKILSRGGVYSGEASAVFAKEQQTAWS